MRCVRGSTHHVSACQQKLMVCRVRVTGVSSPVHVVMERGLWADALADALTVHGLLIERHDALDSLPADGRRALVVIRPTRHGWCAATRLGAHDPARLHVLVPEGLPRHHVIVEALVRAAPMAVTTDASTLEELAVSLRDDEPCWTAHRWVGAPLPFTGSVRRVLHALACQPDTRTRMARVLALAPSTLDVHLQTIKAIVRATFDAHENSDGHVSNEQLVCWARDHGYGLLPDEI